MSKLDKTEVLSAFEAAYEAAHGKKPEITTKPGWYSIDGGKNMRLADVAALTEELTSGSAAPSQEAAPAKKEAKNQRRLRKLKKQHLLLLKLTKKATHQKNSGSSVLLKKSMTVAFHVVWFNPHSQLDIKKPRLSRFFYVWILILKD